MGAVTKWGKMFVVTTVFFSQPLELSPDAAYLTYSQRKTQFCQTNTSCLKLGQVDRHFGKCLQLTWAWHEWMKTSVVWPQSLKNKPHEALVYYSRGENCSAAWIWRRPYQCLSDLHPLWHLMKPQGSSHVVQKRNHVQSHDFSAVRLMEDLNILAKVCAAFSVMSRLHNRPFVWDLSSFKFQAGCKVCRLCNWKCKQLSSGINRVFWMLSYEYCLPQV